METLLNCLPWALPFHSWWTHQPGFAYLCVFDHLGFCRNRVLCPEGRTSTSCTSHLSSASLWSHPRCGWSFCLRIGRRFLGLLSWGDRKRNGSLVHHPCQIVVKVSPLAHCQRRLNSSTIYCSALWNYYLSYKIQLEAKEEHSLPFVLQGSSCQQAGWTAPSAWCCCS